MLNDDYTPMEIANDLDNPTQEEIISQVTSLTDI